MTAFSAVMFSATKTSAKTVIIKENSNLGTIKGMVRDGDGSPIAEAYVSIYRAGTWKLLRQIRSAADGSFLAKIIPGTYKVLAVAQGFNPLTVSEVEVNRETESTYGFNLERSGNGNTLPEKRLDRNNPKWRIRAAESQRSIYQNQKGKSPIDENQPAKEGTEETVAISERENEQNGGRRGQTFVETYFADSVNGNYTGVNFASLVPMSENSEIVFAGQTGTKNAVQRFETSVKFRVGENHQFRFKTAVGSLGKVNSKNSEKSLGQVSFQTFDEWKVKDGVILVLGFDYSRFLGASNDFSLSPRFGLQFDVNAKTRVRTAFTEKQEEKDWAHAAEVEGTSIAFNEPLAIEDLTLKKGKPQINKSRRLEFGIERVLDNKSSIESTLFFDTTTNQGVGLVNLSFDSSNNENFSRLTGNQQGGAQGLRIVYSRRLNGLFSTSAGYSFGKGQKISEKAISTPSDIFEDDFFQSFYTQFDADLKSGTNVKTVFRLSPKATVFAIDPFQGRLAIYDPGLSIFVTQSLPNLGLPFRAEAIFDAKNLFDFQTNIGGEEGNLRLNSQHRILRGGILVRF